MSKKRILVITLLAIFIITLLITNPSESAHIVVINNEISNSNVGTKSGQNNILNKSVDKIEASFEITMINNIIERKNFMLFSLATIKGISNYEEISNKTISLGILGHVFLLKKYDKITKEFVDHINYDTAQSQKSNTSNFNIQQVIGKTIMLGHLEIAQHDFPKQMNWEEAKNACSSLGEGWRLPTKIELNILYQNKDKIGGFDGKYYWSSSEINGNFAWGQSCDLGIQYNALKDDTPFVRAVRSN